MSDHRRIWRPRLPRTTRGLLVFLLVATAVPVLLVQVALTYWSFRTEEEKETQANLELARAVAGTFEAYVKDVGRQDLALGEAVLPLLGSSPQRVTALLKAHDEEYESVRAFSWIAPEGKIVASSDGRVVGVNVAYRDYFQQAKTAPLWVVSDLIQGSADGKPIFIIARAIRDGEGAVQGVITASVDPELLGALVSVPRSRTGALSLYDRQGKIVYRYPELAASVSWEQRSTGWREPMLKEALAGREATGFYRFPVDNELRIGARAPIRSVGWVAGAGRSRSEVLGSLYGRVLGLLGLNVLALGGSLAAAGAVRRRLGQGVRALRDHAAALGRGEPSPAAPQAYRIAELAEVADAVSGMAQSVRRLNRDLERDLVEHKGLEESLRQSEQRLRATFDRAAMGIVEMDLAGRFLAANDRSCEILGYARDEMLAMNVHELTAPEDRARSDELNAQLQEGRLDRIDYEKRYLKRDGSSLWVHVTASTVRDPAGGTPRIIGTIEDISERRRAEEALRRTVEELAQSNRDLEHFAHVTSHDLQEPLRTVSAYARLLEGRCAPQVDESGKRYIDFIVAGAGRMSEMIEGLQAHARACRSGKGCQSVSAEAALQAAVDRLRPDIDRSHATITWDSLPVVQSVPGLLSQLFENLLSNSLKFRAPGRPPVIHVGCRVAGGEFEFSVRDNGIGIAPEHYGRVFVMFQRLHTHEEYPGTGIGLAICRKIVERHGGRIWVQSTGGPGVVFRFTLKDVGVHDRQTRENAVG
jgi:PAS domain S-box-containing protein